MSEKEAPKRDWFDINDVKIESDGITNDNINPQHYKIYRLEMIENIQNMSTPEEFRGYLKGNIIKYLARYQDKNGSEDVVKSIWYSNKLMEVIKKDEEDG